MHCNSQPFIKQYYVSPSCIWSNTVQLFRQCSLPLGCPFSNSAFQQQPVQRQFFQKLRSIVVSQSLFCCTWETSFEEVEPKWKQVGFKHWNKTKPKLVLFLQFYQTTYLTLIMFNSFNLTGRVGWTAHSFRWMRGIILPCAGYSDTREYLLSIRMGDMAKKFYHNIL